MRRAVVTLLILAVVSTCLAKYSGGSGTAEDPYQIGTVADLLALADDTGDYDKHFVLTADIDLDPCLPGNSTLTTAVIAPDGGVAFNGVFDGAGHRIINLTINTNGVGNSSLGLFGNISGQIKNLGLENVSVIGGNHSNAIGGLVGYSDGSISNCHSMGSVTDHVSCSTGGLVGSNAGSISDCYSTCAVLGINGYYLGGLVGRNRGNIA